jgi:hypothetical protein
MTTAAAPSLPHVIHVGFNEAYHRSLDLTGYRSTLLLHTTGIQHLSPEIAAKFERIVGIDMPESVDLDGYWAVGDAFLSAAVALAEEVGPPAAVVALFEHTVLPAALIREHFGVPGMNLAVTETFRDKVKMKDALAGAGVRLPGYAAVGADTAAEDLERVLPRFAGRIVLKPRSQAAALGVRIFSDAAELRAHAAEHGLPDGYEIEDFIDGELCHFDGILRGGKLRFFSASKYLGTPHAFLVGAEAMGSVTIDDPEVAGRAKEFTERVLAALRVSDTPFHLEAFLQADGELVFLEVGSRFGGAGVVPQIRTAYGVDLIAEAFKACVGVPSAIERPSTHLDHGVGASGWLYMPIKEKVRCRVRGIYGIETCPESVVHSELPSIGQVLNEHDGVFLSSGKFIHVGKSTEAVYEDMRSLAASYGVNTVVLGD